MAFPASEPFNIPPTVKAGALPEELNGELTKQVKEHDIEMVRLIGQYLCDKGYSNAYKQLAADSGIILEPQSATDLRAAILAGDWKATEKAIEELAPAINNTSNLAHIRFLLLEQQYLELLEADEVVEALHLLRFRITPLKPDYKRVQNLAQCLMCRTREEVRLQAGGWTGANGDSRARLVECIQRFMPARTMLPPGRLETIVREAVKSQLSNCMYHLGPVNCGDVLKDVSLLHPHQCDIHDFPVFQVQKIEHRENELYFCVFSPDGKYLATGGKDANVEVWRVNPETHTVHSPVTLKTKEASINHLCWSPDSKKIAVCCGLLPAPILVFDVATQRLVCQKHEKSDDVYIAAAFFTDSRKLAFGGLKGGCFYVIDIEEEGGKVLFTHEYCRVQCMVTIPQPLPSISTLVAAAFAASAVNEGMEIDSSLHNVTAPLNLLLVVDHMHRIRLFTFGYTSSASAITHSSANGENVRAVAAGSGGGGGGGGSSSSGAGGVGTASGGAGHIFPVTTPAELWSAARSNNVAPIIMALQSALFPRSSVVQGQQPQQQQSAQPQPTAPVSIPPHSMFPALRQTTSDSGLMAALASHAAVAAASRSHPGSIMAGLMTALDPRIPAGAGGLTPQQQQQQQQQVVVQIQSGTGGDFSLQNLSRGAATAFPSFDAMVAAAASGNPTATAAMPGIVQNYLRGPMTVSSGLGSGSRAGTSRGAAAGGDATSEAATNTESGGRAASGTQTSSSVAAAAAANGGGSGDPSSPPGGGGGGGSNRVFSLLSQFTLIKEMYPIQSILLSPTGKRLLVALNEKGLVLWDLEAQGIIQRFYGHNQVSQRLSYTFCGSNEDFVACGSENGIMHIWRAGNPQGGRPIHSTLAANVEVPVTGVHWNPKLPTMMASVNDDGEIRIWGPSKYVV